MDDFLTTLLHGLAIRLPIYLFCIVGLILVLVRWSRHTKVSVFAFLGIGLLLFGSLGAAVWYSVLPMVLDDWQLTGAQTQWVYSVSAFISLFHDAIALSLLLVAVFIDRQEAKGRKGVQQRGEGDG